MENNIEGLSEQQVEEIGLIVARNKDRMALAIKGKTEVLYETAMENSDN